MLRWLLNASRSIIPHPLSGGRDTPTYSSNGRGDTPYTHPMGEGIPHTLLQWERGYPIHSSNGRGDTPYTPPMGEGIPHTLLCKHLQRLPQLHSLVTSGALPQHHYSDLWLEVGISVLTRTITYEEKQLINCIPVQSNS